MINRKKLGQFIHAQDQLRIARSIISFSGIKNSNKVGQAHAHPLRAIIQLYNGIKKKSDDIGNLKKNELYELYAIAIAIDDFPAFKNMEEFRSHLKLRLELASKDKVLTRLRNFLDFDKVFELICYLNKLNIIEPGMIDKLAFSFHLDRFCLSHINHIMSLTIPKTYWSLAMSNDDVARSLSALEILAENGLLEIDKAITSRILSDDQSLGLAKLYNELLKRHLYTPERWTAIINQHEECVIGYLVEGFLGCYGRMEIDSKFIDTLTHHTDPKSAIQALYHLEGAIKYKNSGTDYKIRNLYRRAIIENLDPIHFANEIVSDLSNQKRMIPLNISYLQRSTYSAAMPAENLPPEEPALLKYNPL